MNTGRRTKTRWMLSVLLACMVGMHTLPTTLADSTSYSGSGAKAYVAVDVDGADWSDHELELRVKALGKAVVDLENDLYKLERMMDDSEYPSKEISKAIVKLEAQLDALYAKLKVLVKILAALKGDLDDLELTAKLKVYLKTVAYLKVKLDNLVGDLEATLYAMAGLHLDVSGYGETLTRLHVKLALVAKVLLDLGGLLKVFVKIGIFLSIGILSPDGHKDPKDPKYPKDPKDPKYPKDPKDPKNPKDPKYPKKPKRSCPTDLEAKANQNTTIKVGWKPAEGSDATNLYRAEGKGSLQLVGTFDNETTSYFDTDTEVDVTYTYMATSVFGYKEIDDCPKVEVTAIPVFPTVLATLAGIAVAGLGYTMFRRRQ